MSARRKLARQVVLTARKKSARAAKHGCKTCRSVALREESARFAVEHGELAPALIICPDCGMGWIRSFSAAPDGQALVSFTVPEFN